MVNDFNLLKKEMMDLLFTGNLVVAGLPQFGKSYFAAWLINEINLAKPETTILISDDAQVLEYILGKDFKVYHVKEDDILQNTLLNEKRIIINTSLVSPVKSSEFIKDYLLTKYQIVKIEKAKIPSHKCTPFISLIDEAGDIWDSYSLRSNKTPFKKIFSQCANYNMHFIFTTNRLASLSTEIVERCQGYIFFKLMADNDIKKVNNILRSMDRKPRNKIISAIQNLLPQNAIFYNGVDAIKFEVPTFDLGESINKITIQKRKIEYLT